MVSSSRGAESVLTQVITANRLAVLLKPWQERSGHNVVTVLLAQLVKLCHLPGHVNHQRLESCTGCQVVTADPIHLKRILTGVCARQLAFSAVEVPSCSNVTLMGNSGRTHFRKEGQTHRRCVTPVQPVLQFNSNPSRVLLLTVAPTSHLRHQWRLIPCQTKSPQPSGNSAPGERGGGRLTPLPDCAHHQRIAGLAADLERLHVSAGNSSSCWSSPASMV